MNIKLSNNDLKFLTNNNFKESDTIENLFIAKELPYLDFYDENKLCEIHIYFNVDHFEICNFTNKGKYGYINQNGI